MLKKLYLSGWLILALIKASFAQAGTSFYYFQQGSVYEKTVYDAKNAIVARQEYHVVSYIMQNGVATASVQTITFKKGKETERTTGLFVADHTALHISMGKAKNGQNIFVDYPASLKTGEKLKSGINFETEARVAGQTINIECTISNRKVLSLNEIITSALGSWSCAKIGYDMELKSKVFGVGIPVSVYVIEWFAPGFGIVRTDIYRNDKLQERRLLTGVRH